MSSRQSKPWLPGERAHQLDVLWNGRRTAPCHYCDKPMRRHQATLDHIHTVAEGGGNESSNLLLACLTCNGRRGMMSYIGFLRLIGKVSQEATLASEIGRLIP